MPSIATTNAQSTFTYQLTEDTFEIGASDGLTRVSIFNGTAVNGTVAGDRIVNGLSGSLTIEENETVTIVADPAKVLNGITITAPASCTLKIVGN